MHQRDGLVIAVCEEKSSVALSPGLSAIFCCVLGEGTIANGADGKLLRRGDIHIGDAHSLREMHVAAKSICLLIAGSAQAWNLNGQRFAVSERPNPPMPATYRRSTTACANLLRLARECRDAIGASRYRIGVLLNHLNVLQTELNGCIARCPGSSMSRKRAVFTRLYRARELIEACVNDDLDISKLAIAANYSIGHFITLYRVVFGETPYASINRRRLAKASCLLSKSSLGLGEIAQSSGFASPSSFTRAIKKHTGKSATEFRMSLRTSAKTTH